MRYLNIRLHPEADQFLRFLVLRSGGKKTSSKVIEAILMAEKEKMSSEERRRVAQHIRLIK